MKTIDSDYLIIGSGLAGLMAAWHLREHGKVLVATKSDCAESNSAYAQGGVACVITQDDSVEEHVEDTLSTGVGLCREDAVRAILSNGVLGIRELERMGVKFAQRDGMDADYDLGQEGGHSRRRVLHAGDITGRELIRVLLEQIHEVDSIELRPQLMAIDLVTTGWLKLEEESRCLGAYFLDKESGEILLIRARNTVLATGGVGKVYLYTSNPDVATGDGVAMAWRAGLAIKNMEMIQFHPTCLYHPEAKSFLVSEAVRGEGAKLVDQAGRSFMEEYDPRGALAPRDIVARAIDHEMKTNGQKCVYLDITHKSETFLRQRFPNIYATCLKFGFDMARDRIPVVPAAHYSCGGIEAAIDGTTTLPGLYAIGEVACTGLHGANRLASNSLLESLVCARLAAEQLIAHQDEGDRTMAVDVPDWQYEHAVPSDEAVVVEHNWNEVRTCMWDYVGIVRTDKRLQRAMRRVLNLHREIQQYYLAYLVTADILELRNITALAALIIRSAQQRAESRGLHYTLDYLEMDDSQPPQDTLIMDPPGGTLVSPAQ